MSANTHRALGPSGSDPIRCEPKKPIPARPIRPKRPLRPTSAIGSLAIGYSRGDRAKTGLPSIVLLPKEGASLRAHRPERANFLTHTQTLEHARSLMQHPLAMLAIISEYLAF
jgi:hypothetical protein